MIPVRDASQIITHLGWVRDGNQLFGGAVARLSEDDLRAASWLPGWSRAHVVSHITSNARALMNLVRWAKTGVETPMYASERQRVEDIERGAISSRAQLQDDLARLSQELIDAFDGLDDDGWIGLVRTAHGREIVARDIPWLRVRELWIHAVDLRTGIGIGEFPAELTCELIADVVAWRSARPETVDVRIVAEEDQKEWTMGRGERADVTVTGSRADLLGWLLGRGGMEPLRFTGGAVELTRWL